MEFSCFRSRILLLISALSAFTAFAKEPECGDFLKLRIGQDRTEISGALGRPLSAPSSSSAEVRERWSGRGCPGKLTLEFEADRLSGAILEFDRTIPRDSYLKASSLYESLDSPSTDKKADTPPTSYRIGDPRKGHRWELTPNGRITSWSLDRPWRPTTPLQPLGEIERGFLKRMLGREK